MYTLEIIHPYHDDSYAKRHGDNDHQVAIKGLYRLLCTSL